MSKKLMQAVGLVMAFVVTAVGMVTVPPVGAALTPAIPDVPTTSHWNPDDGVVGVATALTPASAEGIVTTQWKLDEGEEDGWFRIVETDGSRTKQHIDPGCRHELLAAGAEQYLVDYHAGIVPLPDSSAAFNCNDLLERVSSNDPGASIVPDEPRAGVRLLTTEWKVAHDELDGWLDNGDGTKSHTAKECFTALEEVGVPVFHVDYHADIKPLTDANASCEVLLGRVTSTTSPPSAPETQPSPSTATPFRLVTNVSNYKEGNFWVLGPAGRAYVDDRCRRTLESLGFEVEVVQWNVIGSVSPHPNPPLCNTYRVSGGPDIQIGERVETWVTAASGGTVRLGNYRLDVPAGVMSRDGYISIMEVTINGVASHDLEIHVPWDQEQGVYVQLDAPQVKSTNFDHEIESANISHYDIDRNVWFDEPIDMVDIEAGAVIAHVNDLSPLLVRAGLEIVKRGAKFLIPKTKKELAVRAGGQAGKNVAGAAIREHDGYTRWVCPNSKDSNAGGVTKWVVRHFWSPGDFAPQGWTWADSFRTGCEDISPVTWVTDAPDGGVDAHGLPVLLFADPVDASSLTPPPTDAFRAPTPTPQQPTPAPQQPQPPTPPVSVPSTDGPSVSKGKAYSSSQCTHSSCAFIRVTAPAWGHHQVVMYNSQGWVYRYSFTGTVSEYLFHGYPGVQVWATVNGQRTNPMTWY